LPPWSRRFCNRAELRRVHEAVRSAEIHFVQRIEELGAKLEFHALNETEFPRERKIQGLHARADNRVAANVAKSKCWRSGKCQGIEPLRLGMSGWAENRLAGEVGADWIFAKHRAGIRGISENRNGKREARLNLIDRG